MSDLNIELFTTTFDAGTNEPLRFLRSEFCPEMDAPLPSDTLRFSVRTLKNELPTPIEPVKDLRKTLVSLTAEDKPRELLSVSAMPFC